MRMKFMIFFSNSRSDEVMQLVEKMVGHKLITKQVQNGINCLFVE